MKRFLARLCLFLAIFYLINSAAAFLLAERVCWNIGNKYHWVCNQKNVTADYIYIGSSRVELGIDPRIIDRITGKTSINLGVSGGGAADQYLLLKRFLDHNDVECVVLQLDYITLSDYFSYPFRDYLWLSYDADPEVRSALIDHRGLARYGLWKAIPFLRFMEFSSQYILYLDHDPPPDSPFDAAHGAQRRETPWLGREDNMFVKYQESEIAIRYTKQIIELCRERDLKLIAFQAPFPSIIESKADRSVSDDRLTSITNEAEIQFWDFSRDFYDHDSYFYDKHHMNSHGVDAFSHILAQKLLDNSRQNSNRSGKSQP